MKRTLLIILVALLSLTALFAAETLEGNIIEIEKYGHALLDITIEEASQAGYDLGDTVNVVFSNGYTLEGIPYFSGYYVGVGEPVLRAYPGDTNIAVCVNFGRINEIAGVGVGDGVTITMDEKEGMIVEYELNSLEYSSDRADFRSNAQFANFREIYMGDIAAPGILYRSASPINNEHNRAHYANAFAEAAGVNGVLNLADTNEDVESYIAADDFDSEYYASLYEEGKVLALGMSVDFLSDDFGNKLAAGIEKLSELDPPYLIHCTEGKDRAGFTSALFECLLGGSYDEIVDDFMLSMANYYGVTEETDARKYQFIFENNIAAMLPVITGGEDPTTADLSAAARSYLIDHGMSEEAVDRLVGKLTGSIHVN